MKSKTQPPSIAAFVLRKYTCNSCLPARPTHLSYLRMQTREREREKNTHIYTQALHRALIPISTTGLYNLVDPESIQTCCPDGGVPLLCHTPKTTGLGNIGADTPQGNVMGLHGDYLPGLENCRVVCVTAEWGPMVQ